MSDSMEKLARQRLGHRIRDVRLRSSLNQEEFAAQAGYDRNFWGRIERGQQNPTLSTLMHIASVCGMTVAELVAGIDAPSEAGVDDTHG